MTTIKMECGGPGKFSGPVEYPCVSRLRHRRLLDYLCHQGFQTTFQSMIHETDAHLCGLHLRQLMAQGLWSEAVNYVCRFLPPDRDVEARALFLVLHTLWALANVAAGSRDGIVMAGTHRRGITFCMAISRNVELCSIVENMLNSPQLCASLDWELVRYKAASIAYNLVLKSRRMLPLQGGAVRLHDVLPIGPRRRRHVREEPGCPASRTIARLYLNKRRRLPSSSPRPVTPAAMWPGQPSTAAHGFDSQFRLQGLSDLGASSSRQDKFSQRSNNKFLELLPTLLLPRHHHLKMTK